MGVTIHYQGRLRSAEDAHVLLDAARAEAESLGWQVRRLEPLGVAIQPHEQCDPIELEPDQDLHLDSFVKTQFAGPDVHIQVVGFLRKLATHFAAIEIQDEGEFFETENQSLLLQHMADFDTALANHLDNNPGAHGPVRLPSGRWVDVME